MDPKDNVISDAVAAADKAVVATNSVTEQKTKAFASWMEQQLAKTKRHFTPFDGRVRNRKKARAKLARKANKKRELYVRYGKQT